MNLHDIAPGIPTDLQPEGFYTLRITGIEAVTEGRLGSRITFSIRDYYSRNTVIAAGPLAANTRYWTHEDRDYIREMIQRNGYWYCNLQGQQIMGWA